MIVNEAFKAIFFIVIRRVVQANGHILDRRITMLTFCNSNPKKGKKRESFQWSWHTFIKLSKSFGIRFRDVNDDDPHDHPRAGGGQNLGVRGQHVKARSSTRSHETSCSFICPSPFGKGTWLRIGVARLLQNYRALQLSIHEIGPGCLPRSPTPPRLSKGIDTMSKDRFDVGQVFSEDW